MILTKRFKCDNQHLDVDISIKAKSKDLTRDEMYDKFNSMLDNILVTLIDKEFHYTKIKEVKN